jgi:hypothetical protein
MNRLVLDVAALWFLQGQRLFCSKIACNNSLDPNNLNLSISRELQLQLFFFIINAQDNSSNITPKTHHAAHEQRVSSLPNSKG